MSVPNINDEDFAAFLLDEIDEHRRAEIETALSAAGPLGRSAQRLRKAIAAAREGRFVVPPESLIRAVIDLFPTCASEPQAISRKPQAEPSEPSILDCIGIVLADLIFDSRATPALAGFRGAGVGYQLAYTSQLAEVDLRIAPTDGSWMLTGHVDALTDESASEASLLHAEGEEPITTVAPDAAGTFGFSTEPGLYRIALRIGERLLVLPAFEIG